MRAKIVYFAVIMFIVAVVLGVALLIVNTTKGPTFVDYAAPQLGVAVDKNNKVLEVAANSPAAQAGIQNGDVLLKVGNQNLFATTDTKTIVQSAVQNVVIAKSGSNAKQPQSLSITVNRNGTELTLSLVPTSPPFGQSNNAMPTPIPEPNDSIYL